MEKAFDYLKTLSIHIKNYDLLRAAEYAYKNGLEINLNPDYKAVISDVILYGVNLTASIWINFNEENMSSKLTLENKNKVIFEKEIDETKNGVEFFLDMFKAIVVEDNSLIIKGRKDVDYLPLRILVKKELVN